jgi:hypothetical protein
VWATCTWFGLFLFWWGLNSGLYCLSHTLSPGFFKDKMTTLVYRTPTAICCSGHLRGHPLHTSVSLISAWVGRCEAAPPSAGDILPFPIMESYLVLHRKMGQNRYLFVGTNFFPSWVSSQLRRSCFWVLAHRMWVAVIMPLINNL